MLRVCVGKQYSQISFIRPFLSQTAIKAELITNQAGALIIHGEALLKRTESSDSFVHRYYNSRVNNKNRLLMSAAFYLYFIESDLDAINSPKNDSE